MKWKVKQTKGSKTVKMNVAFSLFILKRNRRRARWRFWKQKNP